MSFNLSDYPILQTRDQRTNSNESSQSAASSPVSTTLSSSSSSSSSSPSSSSDGSSSSSDLNPSDALQSPLTGLLKFEGFSMPQMRDFGISHIDMPNMPSLPKLRSFNMPRFPDRLPDLANNLTTNLPTFQNLTTNMPNLPNLSNLPNLPNFTNLSYLSQLRNVNTAAELQNLFNLFRISANLPNLPTLPQFPQLPQLPQLAPFLAQHFSASQLLKPWPQLRDSVGNMHRRLSEITQRFPTNFHFREWQSNDGLKQIRIYFLLDYFIYYCDSPVDVHNTKKHTRSKNHHSKNNSHIRNSNKNNSTNGDTNRPRKSSHHNYDRHHHHHHHHQHQTNQRPDRSYLQQHQYHQPSPSTSSNDSKHQHSSAHNKTSTNGASSTSTRHELLNFQPLHPLSLIAGEYGRIESFEFDENCSRFVFASGNHLYYFDDHIDVACNAPNQNHPTRVDTKCMQPKTDFSLCPSHSDLVAYLCQGDIWCVNVRTSQEMRVTDVLGRCASVSTSHRTPLGDLLNSSFSSTNNINDHHLDALPFMVGKPSHIIREEFRRHQGFWWRPDSEYHVVNGSNNDEWAEYQLLYEETDQSQVELITLPSYTGTIQGQRFPRPGCKNPVSRLKIAKIKVSSIDGRIADVVTESLPMLDSLFPEYEYLVRAEWLTQDVVFCQLLNRRQTSLVIVLISLTASFESQIIYEEHNDTYWVGVHDILHFLNRPKLDSEPLVEGSELSFIWSSEESGFRHLYLIKTKLGNANTSPKMIFKKQLSEGNWEISDKEFWVDETNMLIYFCGMRDTPLEKHLYVMKYPDPMDERQDHSHSRHKLHRLTELNFSQSNIAFNRDRSIFVNIQSNISVPPSGFVNRIVPRVSHKSHSHRRDHSSRGLPSSKKLSLLLVNSFIYSSYECPNLDSHRTLEPKPSIAYDYQVDLLPGLGKPELFCCQLASGELIYGSIFKPEFMESGVRYPTVLEVYGGPEMQLVSNNFMTLRQPSRHLLSSEGYVVVLIDCRGSGGRGSAFEAHSYRRMGQVEIADQVEVLQWLAKNTGYIDLSRVAVEGWSYGGYLALMALAQYPKIFKVAIAGAPVTNWLMYDTAYTERFMGLPSENSEGYFKGSVLSYVHHFPDQENRLLLFHGMMDENVHFSHTVTLVNALIEAGKPYDLQVFPTERHLLKSRASYENYITCVLSYLQLNL